MVYPRPASLHLRLSPEVGRRLEQLPADLVWASAWRADELAELRDAFGFSTNPAAIDLRHTGGIFFLRLDDPGVSPDAGSDLWWRAQDVLRWSNTHDQPLAWLAPRFTDAVRRDLAADHAAPVLLHEVDPAVGVTDTDIARLTAWATWADALPPAPRVVPHRCRDCGERSSTVIGGRRVDRVHARCGSCCECYCPDDASGDRFAPCGDLASQSCPDCKCCRICVGCHCCS